MAFSSSKTFLIFRSSIEETRRQKCFALIDDQCLKCVLESWFQSIGRNVRERHLSVECLQAKSIDTIIVFNTRSEASQTRNKWPKLHRHTFTNPWIFHDKNYKSLKIPPPALTPDKSLLRLVFNGTANIDLIFAEPTRLLSSHKVLKIKAMSWFNGFNRFTEITLT